MSEVGIEEANKTLQDSIVQIHKSVHGEDANIDPATLKTELNTLKQLLVFSYFPKTSATGEEKTTAENNWKADYAYAHIVNSPKTKLDCLANLNKSLCTHEDFATRLAGNDDTKYTNELLSHLHGIQVPERPKTVAELDDIIQHFPSAKALISWMNLAMQGNLFKRVVKAKSTVGTSDKLERWETPLPDFLSNQECASALLTELKQPSSLFSDYTTEIQGNFEKDWSDSDTSVRICVLGATLTAMKTRLDYAYKKIVAAQAKMESSVSTEETKAPSARKELVMLGSKRIVSVKTNKSEYDLAKQDLTELAKLHNVRVENICLTNTGKIELLKNEELDGSLLTRLDAGTATEGDMAMLALALKKAQLDDKSIPVDTHVLVTDNKTNGNRADTADTIMTNLHDMQANCPESVYYVTTQPYLAQQGEQIRQANIAGAAKGMKVPASTLIGEKFTVITNPSIAAEHLAITNADELEELHAKEFQEFKQKLPQEKIDEIKVSITAEKQKQLAQVVELKPVITLGHIQDTQNRTRNLLQSVASANFSHCAPELRSHVNGTACQNMRNLYLCPSEIKSGKEL